VVSGWATAGGATLMRLTSTRAGRKSMILAPQL
jgi:hypothetical protein